MDEVAETGREIAIAKRGRPVAQQVGFDGHAGGYRFRLWAMIRRKPNENRTRCLILVPTA